MKELVKLLQAQLLLMCATGMLFRSKVSGREVWHKYLEGFGDDPKYRDLNSSVHNCNNCYNFIKRYGNIIAIDSEGKVMSLFDVDADEEYANSMNEMHKLLSDSEIGNVFFETYDELNSLPYESCKKNQDKFRLGLDKNLKRWTQEDIDAHSLKPVSVGEITEFDHFHVDIPKQFVDKTGKSIESITAMYRDKYAVFSRGIEELNLDTLNLVIDLIKQGSLLDGNTHLPALIKMRDYMKSLKNPSVNDLWVITYNMPESVAKFKNTLMGVLCTELSEGMELNKACENWNKRVDPANYKKVSAPVTPAMIKIAKKEFESMGFKEEDLFRRFATMKDINASEILHINEGDEEVKSVSVFDTSIATSPTRHKRSEFDKVEEISIEKFMKDVLPSCTSIEAFVTNRNVDNFVAITTAKNSDGKSMFKWDNNYSWTYKNNLAGVSQIKQAVKSQGGKVDGVLRFSIMWSEGKSIDNSDLDAHCKVSGEIYPIYFSNKRCYTTNGHLDIDITQPTSHKRGGKEVVENITFPSLSKIKGRTFKFMINQFSERSSEGFKAEIEFNGQLYTYEKNGRITGMNDIATVKVDNNGNFSIEHHMQHGESSNEVWGIKTNEFHKVNLMCLSPNYWNNQKVGNKHYMFMIDGAKVDEPLRGFHNENLDEKFTKIRKVMDVLGSKTVIEKSNKKDIAGLGFNSTVNDELIVKVKGSFQRMLKIKF